VLDHHHAVPGIDQTMQHRDQLCDVCHVQAGGGLIEYIERMRIAATAPRFGRFGGWRRPRSPVTCQFGHQFHALCLAAGQRRAVLPQRQVTEADFLHQFERRGDGTVCGEEVGRFVHAHCQHVGNAPAPPHDGARFAVEAGAIAGFAQHPHVGQEGHFDLPQPWPSHSVQRPGPVLNEKRAAVKPRTRASWVSAYSLRMASQKPM
jgi:hypothetical protein